MPSNVHRPSESSSRRPTKSRRHVVARSILPAFSLLIFFDGCALPHRRATADREHVFIKYWPPDGSRRLRLAVKDNIDMKGVVTTAGSEYIGRNSPPASSDAPCLAIARQRNVQIVGKANLSEFAMSPSGVNDYFGTPKSPFSGWFHRFIPGGSSSGAAAAITRGLADVAFGTDTAGSVRTPAACSGIVGLKTTFGLVPVAGVFPIEPQHLDTVGPLAKDIAHTVDGMDLLQNGFAAKYRAAVAAKPSAPQIKIGRLNLSGPDPGNILLGGIDPGNLVLNATDPGYLVLNLTDVRSLFVSLTNPTRALVGGTDPRIDKAVDEALARRHFQVIKLDQSFRTKWLQAQKDANVVAAAGAWMSGHKYQDKLGVSVRTKSVILLGGILHATEYRKALQRQAGWKRTLAEVFKKVDFIALPTLQTLPLAIPPYGSTALLEARVLAAQNTSPANFGGNPALVIPIPVRHADVPVTSLQLIGPKFSEAELLNAGRLIEARAE